MAGLGLLLAMGTALAAQEFVLPNGEKVQGDIKENRLLLIMPGGQVKAPDGKYRMADGRVLVVKDGAIQSGLTIGPTINSIGPKPDDPLLRSAARGSTGAAQQGPAASPQQPAMPAPQPLSPPGANARPSPGFAAMAPIQMAPAAVRQVQTPAPSSAAAPVANSPSQPTLKPPALERSPTGLQDIRMGVDETAEKQELKELIAKINSTNLNLKSTLDNSKSRYANPANEYFLCTADNQSEVSAVTGQNFACKGFTPCDYRNAFGLDGCHTGKTVNWCATTDHCFPGSTCNTATKTCEKSG
jgi:hypothetical protein